MRRGGEREFEALKRDELLLAAIRFALSYIFDIMIEGDSPKRRDFSPNK